MDATLWRADVLVALAKAGYDPVRVADLARNLDDYGRADVLVALAKAGYDSERQLEQVADLVASLNDYRRAEVLVGLT